MLLVELNMLLTKKEQSLNGYLHLHQNTIDVLGKNNREKKEKEKLALFDLGVMKSYYSSNVVLCVVV